MNIRPRSALCVSLLALATGLVLVGVTPLKADTYLWTEGMGGDWNQIFPSPYGPMSPWQDETPFGSNTPPPGGGDTAEIGDVGSPGGPMGLTISASGVTVGTLKAGHTTFTGGLTATQEMDFDGFGSGNCMLAGGTYQTVNLNGAVDVNGASLTSSGDSNVFVNLTAGATLHGNTATLIDGTVDASSVSYTGVATVELTLQNGGQLTTGGADEGFANASGGSSWMASVPVHMSFMLMSGSVATTQDIHFSKFNTVGGYTQALGALVDGAGSKWTCNGAMLMNEATMNDASIFTASNGGTATVSGQALLGSSTCGAEIDVSGAGSSVTTGPLMAADGAAVVTGGGMLTTNGIVTLDNTTNVNDPDIDGTHSLWHVTGDMTVGYFGTSRMRVENGGTLQVDGSLTLAETGASTGQLTVASPHGLAVTGDAGVGKGGTGELDLTGGNGTGNYATIGGSFLIGGTNGLSAGKGTVSVIEGAGLAATNAQSSVQLGVSSPDTGELFVSGAGTTVTLAGSTIVGVAGKAVAGAEQGAVITSGSTNVAFVKSSVAELDVFDQGSTWTCFELEAGGTVLDPADAGTATIAANNYGVIQVQANFFISPAASVYVSQAVPANANQTYPYTFAPGDRTHAGGRIFVGSDAYGPDGTIRIGHGGLLYGQAKSLYGNVTVGAGGKFQPGGGAGTFTVTGDCDLNDGGAGGGETDLQIGGTGMPDDDKPGTDFDQLIATGNVTLGGTLHVSLRAGYTPNSGDEFHIIHAAEIGGSFAGIVSPGLTLVEKIEDGEFIVTVTEVAVGSPPDITSPSTATATVGQPFTYQIVATNGAFTYNATGLPVGLSVNTATGLISGTPTLAGVYQVGLAATSSDHEGDGALTLTVLPAPPPGSPVIGSVLAASAQIGAAFSYQIAASNAPTSYNATGLPAGLSVSTTTGLVSGTPTASGVFTVVLTATNGTGTGTATLTLTVSGPTVPTVTATATVKVAHAEAGTPGVFTISLSAPPSVKTVIRYTLKGSAVNGQDYVLLTGKAKIKPGKPGTTVQIVPRGDAAAGKTVKLVITPSSTFTVGNAAPPKVKIKP